MVTWWRSRTQAERFEFYTRASFYGYVVFAPLFIGSFVKVDIGLYPALTIAALTVVHTVVCFLLVRTGIGHYLGQQPRPVRLMVLGGVLTVVGVGAGFAVYPGQPDGPASAVLLVLAGCYIAALSTAIRPRWSVVAILLACGVAVAAGQGGVVIALGGMLAGVVFAYRSSLWMLGVVRELDRARHVQAGLAVAEERQRFARDLHDVVGRTLSVVSLKAELAAQLAKRGRTEAVDEMLEVRRIAQDSLAELRSIVGGYRAAGLATELAGARALLASAGITCRVVGEAADLPEPVQGALGWVVREGTTNLLRHSEARACTVTLRCLPGAVSLEMENDGAPPGPVPFGGGLIGLTERITALGGKVSATRPSAGMFRLSVELPLS
ncbi:sensor histidine kinase [Dactylosporangium sucinum]|uniref:Histidine kinase n=1 Tax=Dactylosporangium sucinum TaxID=1424081 RepID=A0A917TP60_9ACTN|nr:histidine kinase [Dactylosporangium sucinum]GGM30368.1 histidine kinase [Dactylosporangium sucinum]